jgi:glycosyltransferase involved in cell wall biosynthesis
MISALILTRNEAHDLPGCIQSLYGCSDIHVFDSCSTDDTCNIAQRAGAKVITHPFHGYASQRNAALKTCPFLFDWLLVMDADERLPEGVFAALVEVVQHATSETAAFRMQRRDFFDGRWLKHAQLTPTYIRLFRKGRARYHREINEVLEVDGIVRDIPYWFNHYPFSKGLAYWRQRHITYAEKEAAQWFEEKSSKVRFSLKTALFSKSPQERRYHQKGLFYRMPFRPAIKWCYMMFVRRAFLDGKPGIKYARLQALYESWIVDFASALEDSDRAGKRF